MTGFVLTGAPGAGKSVLAQALQQTHGYSVVTEAATDLIREQLSRGVDDYWGMPDFIARIATEQRRRRLASPEGTVIVDRSPVCTLALARWMHKPVPAVLTEEIETCRRERSFEPAVFLVRPLGRIQTTPVRQITYAQTLDFERTHQQVYRELGYTLVDVPATTVKERVALVDRLIRSWS